MPQRRSAWAIVFVAALVAACGGTPSGATAGPGATPGGQPTEGPGPGETQDGGPVILPGNGSGQVRFEISGSQSKAGELPFFGVGSRFGGAAGVYLSFSRTDGAEPEILSVFPQGEDQWLVGYVSEAFTVSAITCEISNWNISATSASGTFDCQNAYIGKPDGSIDTTGHIKGTFEARA